MLTVVSLGFSSSPRAEYRRGYRGEQDTDSQGFQHCLFHRSLLPFIEFVLRTNALIRVGVT